jgi:hypothetical protein
MDNRLTLGIVHIVEWLRRGDSKTGWKLFELEPIGIASKPEVPVRFWRVSTRQEFSYVEAVTAVLEHWRSDVNTSCRLVGIRSEIV